MGGDRRDCISQKKHTFKLLLMLLMLIKLSPNFYRKWQITSMVVDIAYVHCPILPPGSPYVDHFVPCGGRLPLFRQAAIPTWGFG